MPRINSLPTVLPIARATLLAIAFRTVSLGRARCPVIPRVAPPANSSRIPRPGVFGLIPKNRWTRSKRIVAELEVFDPGGYFGVLPADLADACQVSFDVSHEDRHADCAEVFRDDLQGHGLPGSGRAGDQPVSIDHLRQKKNLFLTLGDEQRIHCAEYRNRKTPKREQERGGGR
jgi:hypothetical protein